MKNLSINKKKFVICSLSEEYDVMFFLHFNKSHRNERANNSDLFPNTMTTYDSY